MIIRFLFFLISPEFCRTSVEVYVMHIGGVFSLIPTLAKTVLNYANTSPHESFMKGNRTQL